MSALFCHYLEIIHFIIYLELVYRRYCFIMPCNVSYSLLFRLFLCIFFTSCSSFVGELNVRLFVLEFCVSLKEIGKCSNKVFHSWLFRFLAYSISGKNIVSLFNFYRILLIAFVSCLFSRFTVSK